jgi:hypothetical protein
LLLDWVGHSKIGAAKIQETHKGLVWERLEVLKKRSMKFSRFFCLKRQGTPPVMQRRSLEIDSSFQSIWMLFAEASQWSHQCSTSFHIFSQSNKNTFITRNRLPSHPPHDRATTLLFPKNTFFL